MDTFEIAKSVLNDYKNEKLSDERIDFLIAQANEQIEEIAQNKEMFDDFSLQVNAPDNADNIILWILFMSEEDRCREYINTFNKGFNDVVPISDLADLLIYVTYLEKVKETVLDGFYYLSAYQEGDIEDVDQYGFTNVLAYVQKSKEVQIAF